MFMHDTLETTSKYIIQFNYNFNLPFAHFLVSMAKTLLPNQVKINDNL